MRDKLYSIKLRGPTTFFKIEYFLCHYRGFFGNSRGICTYTLYFILKLVKKNIEYAGHLEACRDAIPSNYDFYHIQLTFSFPQIKLDFF